MGMVRIAGNGQGAASLRAIGGVLQVTVGVIANMLVTMAPKMGGMLRGMLQRIANPRDCRAGGIQREQKSEKEGHEDAHEQKFISGR